jgi:ABC-2 type transport system ATP-binding protein
LLSDVEDVCDRVVIYYGGKVQAMGSLKELLATPDAVRITTPALPRETMERVLEIIRRDVSDDKVRIDTPTQNLEGYFLDVVAKARERAAATSGAVSGSEVAAYLQGPAETKTSSDRILERFAAPAPTPAQPAVSAPVEKTVDEEKLASLARQAETAPNDAAAPKPESPATPADLSKADEKLSSLRGKKP